MGFPYLCRWVWPHSTGHPQNTLWWSIPAVQSLFHSWSYRWSSVAAQSWVCCSRRWGGLLPLDSDKWWLQQKKIKCTMSKEYSFCMQGGLIILKVFSHLHSVASAHSTQLLMSMRHCLVPPDGNQKHSWSCRSFHSWTSILCHCHSEQHHSLDLGEQGTGQLQSREQQN